MNDDENMKNDDYAIRKGYLCIIKKIHYDMDPPSITVKMVHNNNEIGTEFKYLKKPIVK